MQSFKVAIGIPTAGRLDQLAEVLGLFRSQTRVPDRVIVCICQADELPEFDGAENVEVIRAKRGLPCQRNAILDSAIDMDIILFLDDDFLLSHTYLEETVSAFEADLTVVATTGHLIADGSRKAGYTTAEARAIIACDTHPTASGALRVPHAYGCNMALRLDSVRQHGLRFDERLPLYAWSEDIDFSHRIARYGAIMKLAGARGVHLGTKKGRTSGYQLGYSQIANPVYLYEKGSYSLRRAAGSVGRNLAMNLVRSSWPEPFVDRLGRLRGNSLAIFDMLRGRMRPERILDL